MGYRALRNPTINYDHLIFKRLIDTANSDSTDMAVNAAAAAKKFRYTAPSGKMAVLERLNIAILDNAAVPSSWGAVTATNGLTFKIFSAADVELFDFTDGEAINSTGEMSLLAGTDAIVDTAAGVDSAPIRWTLAKCGESIPLVAGDYFACTINDDFSGMNLFQMMIQGVLHDYTS